MARTKYVKYEKNNNQNKTKHELDCYVLLMFGFLQFSTNRINYQQLSLHSRWLGFIIIKLLFVLDFFLRQIIKLSDQTDIGHVRCFAANFSNYFQDSCLWVSWLFLQAHPALGPEWGGGAGGHVTSLVTISVGALMIDWHASRSLAGWTN